MNEFRQLNSMKNHPDSSQEISGFLLVKAQMFTWFIPTSCRAISTFRSIRHQEFDKEFDKCIAGYTSDIDKRHKARRSGNEKRATAWLVANQDSIGIIVKIRIMCVYIYTQIDE